MSRREVSEVQHWRGRFASAVRHGHSEQEIEHARRSLALAKIVQYIEDVLADSPPLTDEDRERLVQLIRAGTAAEAGE